MKTLAVFATALLFAATAEVIVEDKNPGHLKTALVSLKALYSYGPDTEKNKANIQTPETSPHRAEKFRAEKLICPLILAASHGMIVRDMQSLINIIERAS